MKNANRVVFGYLSADKLASVCRKWQSATDEELNKEFGEGMNMASAILPYIGAFLGENAPFSILNPDKTVADLIRRFGEECIKTTFATDYYYVHAQRILNFGWSGTHHGGISYQYNLLPIPTEDIELILQLIHGNENTKKEFTTLLSFYKRLAGEEAGCKIKHQSEKAQRYLYPVAIFY